MSPNRQGMDITAIFIGLILSLSFYELSSALAMNGSEEGLKQRAEFTKDANAAGFSSEVSSVKCKLQVTARLPAFSIDGDYVIGGVFSIHRYKHTVRHNYTSMPELQRCTGRLVRERSGGNDNVMLCENTNVWLLWRAYIFWCFCVVVKVKKKKINKSFLHI